MLWYLVRFATRVRSKTRKQEVSAQPDAGSSFTDSKGVKAEPNTRATHWRKGPWVCIFVLERSTMYVNLVISHASMGKRYQHSLGAEVRSLKLLVNEIFLSTYR